MVGILNSFMLDKSSRTKDPSLIEATSYIRGYVSIVLFDLYVI